MFSSAATHDTAQAKKKMTRSSITHTQTQCANDRRRNRRIGDSMGIILWHSKTCKTAPNILPMPYKLGLFKLSKINLG